MWHEARKHEKLLRNTMIDQSKRAERKRRYYEQVRKDPEQFMQIHGHKSHIYADSSIAKAAEDSNILRAWQGEASITIDRFDARSHLTKMDLMDDTDLAKKQKKEEVMDEKEEIVSEFERYRVLIINDHKGVTEKNYLRKIAEHEFWQIEKENTKKLEAEKKKKSADKKSSIGFTYEDSEIVNGTTEEQSDEDSEEEIAELEDIDVDLDINQLNPESQRNINKLAEDYGVRRSLFCALLRADQQAQRDAAQLKQIDRQKAQLSGRESKHERMLLRQQRQAIVGKGCQIGDSGATATLLGFINNSSKKSKFDEMMKDLNSSDHDDDKVKPEFITTFGGEEEADSDEEMKKSSQGPELPSEQYRKILELSKKRNQDETVDWSGMKMREKTPPIKFKRRSRSRSRERRRTRSPPRRSRSRDRNRRIRSRSRSKNRRRRSRTRSYERKTNRRSRSSSRRRDRSRRRSRSNDRYHRRREDRNRSHSRSRSRSIDRKRKNKSPEKNMFKRKVDRTSPRMKSRSPHSTGNSRRSHSKSDSVYDSDNEKINEDERMVEIRSSMSESEKERIEIENRKRRVKLTKKMAKGRKQGETVDGASSDEDDEEQRKSELARKMKQKMSQVLKKARKEMEKEEEEKRKEADVQKRVREELRYIEEQERKERERTKREAKEKGEKRRRRSRSKSPRRRD